MMRCKFVIFILLSCGVLAGCFKIKSKTPATVEPTLNYPAGRYNPLPTSLSATFSDEINMSSVSANDFQLRDSCVAGPIAASQVQTVGSAVVITLANSNVCTNGESFTLKVRGFGIKYDDSNKRSEGISLYDYTLDTTSPTVAGAINSLSSLTTSQDFAFASVPAYVTYTFSDDINLDSVVAADFAVASAGGTDCTTMPTVGTLVKNSTSKTVRVPLSGGSCADGESFRLTLPEDAVSDSTRNGSVVGGLAANTAPAADLSFDILRWSTAVAVTSVGDGATTADGTYHGGDMVDIVVSFNGAVTVTGTPRLKLNIPSLNRYAFYQSGSGTTDLVFRYTVVSGDTSSGLDYSSTSALQLNGGTISLTGSNGGIVAGLTLASPGSPNSLGDFRNILIDATEPTITTSSPAGPTNSWGSAARDVTFTFSEALDPASLIDGDLTVTPGTCSGVPTVSSSSLGGAGNTVVTFSLSSNTCLDGETYTVALSPSDVDDAGGLAGSGSARSIAVTTELDKPILSLGSPTQSYINSSSSTAYSVSFTGATSISLSDTDVQLAGANADCTVAVTGSGLSSRTITVADCSGDGSVQLSVDAGTASNSFGNSADAVNEAAVTDFIVDNLELPDPTSDLPTVGSEVVYNETTAANFTLTFAGDVLGTQSELQSVFTLTCNSNTVSKTVTRTSATVVTIAPNEASGDFVHAADCEIEGSDVPDAAGNLHSFSAIAFKVTSTPDSISGPSGSISISTATSAGDLGSVVFNVAMDASTVDTSNVSLTCDSLPVAITVLSASVGDTSFLIDFDESDANWMGYVGGESCVLEFSTNVTNSLAVPLSAPEVFSFTLVP